MMPATSIRPPAFPAATAVAAPVQAWFSDCHGYHRQHGGEGLATAPDRSTIERITNAGFWASLQREEGRPPRISLAYLRPDQTAQPLLFERALPLEPRTLTSIAPAVESPGIHLGVWQENGELYIWGTCLSVPPACFVLEVVEPGLLVIKARRGPVGAKFANIAVISGDQVKVIDEVDNDAPIGLPLIASLLGFNSRSAWSDPFNGIVQIAASMRAHGRGGTLLVVQSESESWRESIVHPISYAVTPAFTQLERAIHAAPGDSARWESINRAASVIAGLTAVDGATIINDRYQVLAFGAKIARAAGRAPLGRVKVFEPIVDVAPLVADVSYLGGTRHLYGAQFVYDQPDALALVASQDGRFTIFAWSPDHALVQAHRVELLLM